MRIGIVGAGPAGSLLAYRLGLAGASVVLYDKRDAWEKPCGGGVTSKVMEEFPEVRESGLPSNRTVRTIYRSPAGQEVDLERDRPVWIYSRRVFDGHLRALALGRKTVRFRRERVLSVDRSGGCRRIRTGDSKEPFDLVVGADGALSRVRRCVYRPIPKRHLAITGGYFVSGGGTDTMRMELLAQAGYLWAFPRVDHVCIGGGAAVRNWDLFGRLDVFRERHFPRAQILARWGAPIPFIKDQSFFDLPAAGDGWALVGDAAGHVDAVTGEGIYFALRGAELLADAVLAGAPDRYEEAWRDTFGTVLRRAVRRSQVFYSPRTLEAAFAAARIGLFGLNLVGKFSPGRAARLRADSTLRKRILNGGLRAAGWLRR